MIERGFKTEKLDIESLAFLKELSLNARGDILTMTTLAGCGHPGGSMSSIDIYLTLYCTANIFPENPYNPKRDRIVVSHGHTSPGVYAALSRTGFFSPEDAIAGFRKTGSPFEGHIERTVPGVEWATGNLGQGLSAGCGFALASRIKKIPYQTFVCMGDGEQQKGQISEARRFAIKHNISNITAIIDKNNLQISGSTADIMPQNIKENFISDGWRVIEINGHDFNEIYDALYKSVQDTSSPCAIIANTVMGKGVSFMENVSKFHGVALNEQDYLKAMDELGVEPWIERCKTLRNTSIDYIKVKPEVFNEPPPEFDTGKPFQYTASDKTDNRSAFGKALKDIASINSNNTPPIAVFDCDLAGSVKTDGFAAVLPNNFFQAGIQEHNTASIAGALSTQGILTFFADFGVFGICETYNQHRLNAINHTNLKIVCTHIGLDVGEDGKTHQCIDYIGLLNNIFGIKAIIPADPNQTDKATRFISSNEGIFMLGMGRSKTPVILDSSGNPFFGNGYTFCYGRLDTVREGNSAAIITCGGMLQRAVKAHDILQQQQISVRIINASCPLDINENDLAEAAKTGIIFSYEDHNVKSGIGSIIADKILSMNLHVKLIKLGVTGYGLSGPPDELYNEEGLDENKLAETVKNHLSQQPSA